MDTRDTLERVGNHGNLLGARSVARSAVASEEAMEDKTNRTAIGRFHPGSTGSSLLIAVCVLVTNDKYMKELTYKDSKIYDMHREMAEELVKARIVGERKGMPGEANYLHSFRVRDLVSKCHHWDDPEYDVFLAALLHDVVEDGGVTLGELRGMGFTDRTVALVDLCTHRMDVENSTERWMLMMARLVEARDDGAWRIKKAGLSPENRRFMVETKAPLMVRLTEGLGFNKVVSDAGKYVAPIVMLRAEAEKQRTMDNRL